MAPAYVREEWETPDVDALPDDASWETPYVWDAEQAEWERVRRVAGHLIVDGEEVPFDSEETYMAASRVPEVRTE
jgi:hypothetical protein